MNRSLLIASIMAAATMITLDATIANVALPHIQQDLGGTHAQMAWVLTSYIVAGALGTPLTGWLSARFGRKRLLVAAAVGFTVASMLCGVAETLPQMVAFRFLQGLCGAPVMPLSQAVMLDNYPRERHGRAMAVWGMGTLVGTISGPVVGGYITDALSWRWVFFINLPIGLLAIAGLFFFLRGGVKEDRKPFDFLGFATLVGFLAAVQLMLDRGPGVGWFAAPEVWIYAAVGLASLAAFVAHTLRAVHPFFDKRLGSDRNFTSATLFGFVVAMLLMSAVALLPAMTQSGMGRTALDSGLLMVPRGLGVLVAMFTASRLAERFDSRLVLLLGLVLTALANGQMSRFGVDSSDLTIMVAGFVHGLGLGILFVPMNVIAFATVPQALRAEAATVNTIVRNMGGAIGISVMQALLTVNSRQAVAAGERTREALMGAYRIDYGLMVGLTACCLPLLLLMRPPGRKPPAAAPAE